MNKTELTGKLNDEVSRLRDALHQISNEAFFQKKGSKWSVAENVRHLSLSAKPLNLALSLPKIILKLLFGKPYRPSYPYDEIVKRYHQLLTDGAVATGAYVPKSVPLIGDKSAFLKYSSTAGFE